MIILLKGALVIVDCPMGRDNITKPKLQLLGDLPDDSLLFIILKRNVKMPFVSLTKFFDNDNIWQIDLLWWLSQFACLVARSYMQSFEGLICSYGGENWRLKTFMSSTVNLYRASKEGWHQWDLTKTLLHSYG